MHDYGKNISFEKQGKEGEENERVYAHEVSPAVTKNILYTSCFY